MRQWLLEEVNLAYLRENRYETAVIPVGATEPHNLHLPYGQDIFHATYVARSSCEKAAVLNAKVVCLPTLPFGVDSNLMDFPMTINVSQNSLDAMLRDIFDSLNAHGIRKIVIVNGHGGNDFIPLIRHYQSHTDCHIFNCNWWKVGADRYSEFFIKPDDHAGELETSVALHLFPQLVDLAQAGPGTAPGFRFRALREGWVQTSRSFARLNDHCAVGDPSKADAANGKAYLELVIDRLSEFLVEVSDSEIDQYFPHLPG